MTAQTETISGLAHPASLRAPLALAISCFLIWGLAYGLLDVLNKHFQDTLDVSKAQSSWLQIAYFGAYLLLSLPAGWLMQRAGYKAGIVTGLVVAACGAFLFLPAAEAASFPFFVGSTFVLAAGLCFLETAADTYVNVLGPPERAAQRLNLAQSFNALGVFIGPLIGGALFFDAEVTTALGGEQRSVQLTYAAIGVGILLYALVISRVRLPELRETGHSAPATSAGGESGVRQRHFVLGVATQALYVGAQVGVGAYFINLVTETWPGLSSQQGAYLLSAAAGAYLVGRFASTALLSKIDPRVLLIVYGTANVVLCLVVAAAIERVSALALIGVFFFMSAMFATIFTLGLEGLGAATKRGASIMVMAIGGGVLLPYPMGVIADAHGTAPAFLLPAAIFAIVALYGWRGTARGASRNA